jgi:hypothetical protein
VLVLGIRQERSQLPDTRSVPPPVRFIFTHSGVGIRILAKPIGVPLFQLVPSYNVLYYTRVS